MDTRFAGSQRLGDRRRRRLAVESEEAHDPKVLVNELPASDGTRRIAHAKPNQPTRTIVALPMTGLVPLQWWKYAVGGLSGLLAGSGILAAGWYESIGATFAGQGVTRLFGFPDGPVVAWYAGLLLNLSAQLALLIWWGRSRSLKDFDGRYRLWTRTAAVWLTFSFCASTGTHRAFSETVQHLAPLDIWGIDVLAWLVPASALGLILLVSLNREMLDCRASRALLFVAATCYVAAGGLRLPVEIPLTDPQRQLTWMGSALLGHLCLFLSMWLHARHVLHFTPDPSSAPRRCLRFPRPHFRLSRLAFGRRRAETETVETEETTAAERRDSKRRRRKATSAGKRPVKPVAAAEHDEVGQSATAPVERAPIAEHEPLTLPSRREPQRPPLAPPPMPEPPVAPPPREHENEDATNEEEAWTEPFPKPDMRGMSKKQRRRLMQELRERERSAQR